MTGVPEQGGGATFVPARLVEVDIGRALPAVSARDPESGRIYRRALSLVRLGRQPFGVLELRLEDGDLQPTDYAQQIWSRFAGAIGAHLRRLNQPEINRLAAEGLHLREPPTASGCCAEATVVVATRDRPDTLAACLDSLLASDCRHYDILVVDSAPSTSSTADLIARRFGHVGRLRYLYEPRPGLATAHNRALEHVTTPIVAFTDDDVLADRYWLAEIVREFSASETVGCVTGLILPIELETASQEWIEQYGGFSKGFERRLFDLRANRLDQPLYPYAAGTFGSGANMAFRTAALWEIGGFDPALGAGTRARGADDLAAFFEILAAGYGLVYQPAAMVRHRHRRDYAGLQRQAQGYGVGLMAYLTKLALDHPGRLFDMAGRSRHALYHVFGPNSGKNRHKRPDYPSELNRLELRGMMRGPLAYLHSRWQTRDLKKRLIALRRDHVTRRNAANPGVAST